MRSAGAFLLAGLVTGPAVVWAEPAASFADKIFKGAKPADLPVEQPTKFELGKLAKIGYLRTENPGVGGSIPSLPATTFKQSPDARIGDLMFTKP